MRIDAVTCCVGHVYAEQLSKSLPIWLDTCDSVTIVTDRNDQHVLAFLGPRNLRVIFTDIFYWFGASLNKAAGLCLAYARAEPLDWCLHFDADIIPPRNWRRLAEPALNPGKLHGAPRDNEDGRPHDHDGRFHPWGYFQLWHTTDRRVWRWPIFDPWHPSCGCYDADFADLWPKTHWRSLPFRVIHQGTPRHNWFGVGNEEKMKPLKEMGLFQYRMACRQGKDRLPIPEPELKFMLRGNDPTWIREVLRACAYAGPFSVRAEHGHRTRPGYEPINQSTAPTEILERVLALCPAGA